MTLLAPQDGEIAQSRIHANVRLAGLARTAPRVFVCPDANTEVASFRLNAIAILVGMGCFVTNVRTLYPNNHRRKNKFKFGLGRIRLYRVVV